MLEINVKDGSPIGFGAVQVAGGVNFSIYSKDAEKVCLCLFESENSSEPSHTIELDSIKNKTGDIWHVFVEGLSEGALYLYLIDGPYDPTKGKRFNVNKYLFDPYAKAFSFGSVFKSYNN